MGPVTTGTQEPHFMNGAATLELASYLEPGSRCAPPHATNEFMMHLSLACLDPLLPRKIWRGKSVCRRKRPNTNQLCTDGGHFCQNSTCDRTVPTWQIPITSGRNGCRAADGVASSLTKSSCTP